MAGDRCQRQRGDDDLGRDDTRGVDERRRDGGQCGHPQRGRAPDPRPQRQRQRDESQTRQGGDDARDDVARSEEKESDPFQQEEKRPGVRDLVAGDRRLALKESPGVIGSRRFVRVEGPTVEA